MKNARMRVRQGKKGREREIERQKKKRETDKGKKEVGREIAKRSCQVQPPKDDQDACDDDGTGNVKNDSF